MKRKLIPILVALLVVATVFAICLPAVSKAAEEKVYTADDSVASEDIVAAWDSGEYDYIQLAADTEIVLDGQKMVVDLAGYDLTASGKGKLYAFDTANDTYDHTQCGTLTCKGVTCAAAYTAPNGNYYVALGEGRYTFHRLEMKLTSVSLRMSVAGVYYNATFSADRLIRESVDSYGVAVSVVDMPDENFRTDDLYTQIAGEEMVNGAVVNSGIIENILKTDAEDNSSRGSMDIYARLYLTIDGKDYLSRTGAKKSLKGLMDQLDSSYTSLSKTVRGQLDAFHNNWKAYGTAWTFSKIGKTAVDLDTVNQPLVLDENNQAICPVCGTLETWTLITSEARQTAVNGGHYYLNSDVEYTEEGSSLSYFGAPGTQKQVACLHLNEHNITATNVRAIYGSSGVVNVMGNGIVSGYTGKSNEGAAIHTGNKNVNNGINLYGGTYRKTAGSASGAAVIATGGGGRIYTVYKGATIDGGTGLAIYADGESTHNGSIIELLGCTVNGNIAMSSQTAKVNTIEVIDATVNGTLTAREGHNVTLSGKVKLNKLVVPAGVTVSTNSLEAGSAIAVDAIGYFTEASANLSDYNGYFTAVDSSKGVFVRNNKLFCGKDYVSNLNITVDAEGNHNAYCPVCEKTVAWTPIDQTFMDTQISTGNTGYFLADGSHYYLTQSVSTYSTNTYAVFGVPSTESKTSCFHLNGFDLIAEKSTVFYSANGILNVMGDGTVKGAVRSNYGGVVHSNNRNLNSQMNFYAGTYENVTDSGYVIRIGGNGGRLYFYEDATVKQNGASGAFWVNAITGRSSSLSLSGTTVYGDVFINGVAANNEFNASFTMLLDNASISGDVVAKGVNGITLLNDVQIGLLDVTETSKVNLTDGETDGITIGTGARVTVKNVGTFALEYEESGNYLSCFETLWRDDTIVLRDNALTYKPNYEMALQYNSEGKARCPICQEYYTWTEISSTTESVQLTGGHYFLSGDVAYSGMETALVGGAADTLSCLHLNGNSITATQASAIAAGAGAINVMGEGTVTGNTTAENAGAAVVAEGAATGTVNLYSATYKKYDTEAAQPIVSVSGKGGTIAVYEDAHIEANGGTAAYIGGVADGTGELVLDRVSLNGDLMIAGADDSATAVVNTYNITVNGDVTVSGTNDITFSGKTDISGKLNVAEGSLIGLADMVQPDVNIVVNAEGIFTSAVAKSRAWATYFTAEDSANNWIVARDGAIECSERVTLSTNDSGAETLEAAYADLEAKYGEMHNHTSAGLTADGRRTLAQWKERMVLLNMSFATIVDHKQVAHMYHKDWQNAPTEEYDVVFVGGSEPGTNITEMLAGTQGNMHYNMLTGDPQKLVELVQKQENDTGKNFYSAGVPYAEANWGPNALNGVAGTNNKNKDFVYTDYNEPDGLLDRIYYPSWTRTEFINMVKSFYDVGCLIVEVHPDYPSYIKSTDPMDYCFSGNAGSDEEAAMGFEIHTGNYGYMPSKIYNEQAYQLWLDMLDAGKKVYATYGDDGHRLPTAVAMTTIYAPDGADAAYYMQKMHEGNFAPGWVGIRMMIGDTKMGGTADSFDGKQLVFSIGDMYAANDYSRKYLDKSQKEQLMTWEPGYVAEQTYTLRVYDDSGLLSECEVNPSEMNYYAIDAKADAKFYRVEVWTENADGSIRYRCGVGNPIWNAAAYATETPAE